MKRRDFIKVIAGSLAAWPLAARAQQPAMPVIGFLDTRSPQAISERLSAYRQGLKEAGYIEGEKWRLCTASPKTKSIDCRN